MERITQAQAIKATAKAVRSLVALAQAITSTNLDIGRVFNKLAADPNTVIANTADADKLDDSTKGIDLGLGAIAVRAGFDKQRVSEWRDNARVHDIGIGEGLDMDRAGSSVGKDLPNGASSVDIAAALCKAFDASDKKHAEGIAKAKGRTNKAKAKAKAKNVTRRMVSDAAGIPAKKSGNNNNGGVTTSTDFHIALAGAGKQAGTAIAGLASDGHKGNVLVGNDRTVAKAMILSLTNALKAKVTT